MPILDFKEIPQANIADGRQDSFELFARDFLKSLGYKILEGPDRGIDGGRDIIILEVRKGIGGESEIKWLVSCKHHVHSRKSVSVKDEPNILERVKQNNCNGFLGFYSTVPSSQLTTRLKNLKSEIEYSIFDQESIETNLLTSSSGFKLAQRYFPKSFKEWKIENPKPAKIFSGQETLHCEYCGKDLLNPKSGIIVIWQILMDEEKHTKKIIDIYWCCKGKCDKNLKAKYSKHDIINRWDDIPDVCIPLIYINWSMAILNQIYNGFIFSEPAFDKLKQFMVTLFPYVARESTKEEKERIKSLLEIPSFLGGLGPN